MGSGTFAPQYFKLVSEESQSLAEAGLAATDF